tara:strand:- start:1024 stop:2976 length:1953 start_codon:yes stop_codon:yes gene_type:complete
MELYSTLIDLLESARDKKREIRFIDGENDESIISFSDLWGKSQKLLGSFQDKGMRPGDELIIFSKSNKNFVTAFWAAILGGMVPVPVAVGISDEHRLKLFRIFTQLDNATLYTEEDLLIRLIEFAKNHNLHNVTKILKNRTILTNKIDLNNLGKVYRSKPNDISFIQYSSGSTSDPKGVVLSHQNVCINIRAIAEACKWTKDDQSLSWMPLTHDMGLIGYHLSILGVGMNNAIMDTNVFIRRPLLWMTKADEIRATQLCSPNFGYKHFLKLYQRKGIDELDLSCVKLILNGAEPISWDLCEEFLDALKDHKLSRKAMLPVYGLAEATVGVSIPKPGKEYSKITVDRHSLKIGESPTSVPQDHDNAVNFLKVGNAIRDVNIRITDDSDKILNSGVVGNIQLSGKSVTDSIYGDDIATASLFTKDKWLRTGDCGLLDSSNQLVITGRQKDIIIVNGQNYYPHDIEEIIAKIDGFDLNKVVVAGATPENSHTEEILAFILYRKAIDDFLPIIEQVCNQISEQIGLQLDGVIPVSKIPKTTSGKVQRVRLLNAYFDGDFEETLNQLKSAIPPEDSEIDGGADKLLSELLNICSEFIKERKVSADDNLFEIGITSITLVEIVLAIDEKYPKILDISDLFDHPTLREVSIFMKEKL